MTDLLKQFLKNPLKYVMAISQIIVLVKSMYQSISAMDDDPEIIEIWKALKANPVIADRVSMLRVQAVMVVELVKELEPAPKKK